MKIIKARKVKKVRKWEGMVIKCEACDTQFKLEQKDCHAVKENIIGSHPENIRHMCSIPCPDCKRICSFDLYDRLGL